ncbi:hypothetical protein TNIN_21301 [Trichonephila inaurata madagascariensis]|uniref:Uncharacterized protein n=1 Tax=Trichonephila inaurata madagascariensis TaxID=2747483 RepID=A0A8X6YG41_9ARAC|nr:hypothetical protein TNIN_21301 [Trichonephila inaurata madagascariensis]
MDLNFDTLLDWNPERLLGPSTPTKICSQLQQLAKEVDQYFNICLRDNSFYRCAESLWVYGPDNLWGEGTPEQTVRVYRSTSSSGK